MPTMGPLDDQAIDAWLQASLRRRHSEVLREPLPDALTRLLQPTPDA